jgi:glycosyltransferase involved in cell wall biosynthesis
MVKIACIGNSNHTFFCLTRYLRDRGLDAELLVFDTDVEMFHPSGDTYRPDFTEYTRFLLWGACWDFVNRSPDEIAEELSSYDLLIGCGPAPAFAWRAGRLLDIFSPYGSDAYQLPFFRFEKQFTSDFPHPRALRNALHAWRFARGQAVGLAETRRIISPGKHLKSTFEKFGHRKSVQWQPLPLVYLPAAQRNEPEPFMSGSPVYQEALDLRRRHGLIVFHHSRHIWCNPPDRFSAKGNDVLIRGFADFARTHTDASPCLMTFDHGPDVGASKELIRNLGIEDRVYWFRRLRRKDIMILLQFCDVTTGTFSLGWWGNAAIFESLASGKSMISHRDDEVCRELFSELYPMIQARTPDQVSAALSDIVQRPEAHEEIGRGGREWLKKHVLDPGVDGYINAIQELL